MTVEMVDPQGTILREIADPQMKRNDVAMTYAFCLRQGIGPNAQPINFAEINAAIMHRWSLSALAYIKERAWGIHEGRIHVG